ncbi:hypothetical protein AYO37_01115 [Opitutia bacterium SCGC AG-212-L18]|nr:hypothetical protein AYO37_01115 [Opitutae bacterium SCGC AG-212-L18]
MNIINQVIEKSPILQGVENWISEPSEVRIVFGRGVFTVSRQESKIDEIYIKEWVKNAYEGLFTRTVSTQTTQEQEMVNYINKVIDIKGWWNYGLPRCQSAIVFERFRTAFSIYLREQLSLLESDKRNVELKKQNITKDVGCLMINHGIGDENILQEGMISNEAIVLLLMCFGEQWRLLEGNENNLRFFKIEQNVKLALEVINKMKNPISEGVIKTDAGLSITNKIIDSDVKKVLLFVAVVALSFVALATDLRVIVMSFMIFDLLLSVIGGKKKVA